MSVARLLRQEAVDTTSCRGGGGGAVINVRQTQVGSSRTQPYYATDVFIARARPTPSSKKPVSRPTGAIETLAARVDTHRHVGRRRRSTTLM